MKIFDYIATLSPKVEKDTILEDIRATKDELQNIVKPTYTNASDHFRISKFMSEDVKALEKRFYNAFDRGSKGKQSNFISEIAFRVDNLIEAVTCIEEAVEKNMERLTIRDGISAKRAVIVRGAEETSFLARFAIDLLNYVYSEEAKAIAKSNKENIEDTTLSPADIKHVETRIGLFSAMLGSYANDPKRVDAAFKGMPDVVISESTRDLISSVVKAKDLDPLNSVALSGFTYNPIYHIRMVVAEWQTSRYNANKEKKRELELRLVHLELLNEKSNDGKIEREISYIRNRVSKLEKKMRDEEESASFGA